MTDRIQDIKARINTAKELGLTGWSMTYSDMEWLFDQLAESQRRERAVLDILKKHITPYNGTACKICTHDSSYGCKECNFELRIPQQS